MPAAIVATPGAADANSFASVAEYIAYAADRLDPPDGVTVSGGTITDRETQALLEAARDLDALPWPGVDYSTTQRLRFPRYAEVWRERLVWQHNPADTLLYLGGAAIPRRLKEAQIELAFAYLSGESPMQADTNAGVVRKKVDVLETEWAPGERPQGLARYPRVLALIAPLLGSGGAVVRT